MGIFDEIEMSPRKRIELGVSLPTRLNLEEIADLWASDDESYDIFKKDESYEIYKKAMLIAAERGDLKVLIDKEERGFNAYDHFFGGYDDLHRQRTTTPDDFLSWLKKENITKPVDSLLANWWKDQKADPDETVIDKPQKPADKGTTKRVPKNERRNRGFQAWIDETKPDLDAMTWDDIHEALKPRDRHLWNSKDSFDKWKTKQQIHKKPQTGRPSKPR